MMRTRPIIVGIVGDSAAGKTTMTRGLVNILGPDRVEPRCVFARRKFTPQVCADLAGGPRVEPGDREV